MWTDRKSKGAYALAESVLSLFLLSMVISTLIVPLAQTQQRLADKKEETERWRFLQDYLKQAQVKSDLPPEIRLSDRQTMEVFWKENGKGVSLRYSAAGGPGSLGVDHVADQ